MDVKFGGELSIYVVLCYPLVPGRISQGHGFIVKPGPRAALKVKEKTNDSHARAKLRAQGARVGLGPTATFHLQAIDSTNTT
jgi:hypothetical protein